MKYFSAISSKDPYIPCHTLYPIDVFSFLIESYVVLRLFFSTENRIIWKRIGAHGEVQSNNVEYEM